jgi:hypothetical protein
MQIIRKVKRAQAAGPNTLGVNFSHDLRDRWELKLGDPLVLYEMEQALVVLPLSWVQRVGEPRLLEALRKIQG